MQITRITRQKWSKNYYSVYADGVFAFTLSDEAMVKLGLKAGMDIDMTELAPALAEDARRQAMDIALYQLGIRSRSEKELRQALARKKFEAPVIAHVMSRLAELGYLNDERFARDWTNYRLRQGKGPEIVRMELRQKGIDQALISQSLSSAEVGRDEQAEIVYRAARRKYEQVKKLPPRDAARRLTSFLARRGFLPDTVRAALNRLKLESVPEEETVSPHHETDDET